jgi:type IV fimbrial biogenesis protein FimT
LYELLVTLTITSGLVTAGAGVFQIVRDATQTAEINTLVGHLNLARSEAIKRGQDAVLCPSTDGRRCDAAQDYTWWHRGMFLFVDTDGNHQPDPHDPVIRIYAPSATLRIKSSRGRPHVIYQPNGLASGTNMTFTFCDPRGTAAARYVIVSNTGRARVLPKPPDGKADEGLERCP